MVLGVEQGEAVRGGNVEAVEVMDGLMDGCRGGQGLQCLALAPGHVVVARQGIDGRRCDEVARRHEVGILGDAGQVPRQLHGMKWGGRAGAVEILKVRGEHVQVLNILVDVAVERQDGPIGCRRCWAGTDDVAIGDDVGVGGGRVVEKEESEGVSVERYEADGCHFWF